MRLLRLAALTVGALVLLVTLGGLLLLGVRLAQAWFLPAAPPTEHLAEKQRYLASLPELDTARAPSFVVILFDDLGWGDLSVQGNALIQTPRIDRAAAEGLRLTDFYSASPVCSPSRAALLTGRYPPRTGTDRHVFFPARAPIGLLRRVFGLPNDLPRDEITLAEVLGAAGYATGMVGKWHLGDLPGHRPNDFGFQSWLGVLYSNDMAPLDLLRDDTVIQADTRPGQWRGERDEQRPLGPGGIDQSRLTEAYTNEAVRFLETHRDEPFFLYLAHTFPHVPHYASPDHAGESAGGLYGDVVEDLDRSTGAVLDALDRLGLAARTAVFITSDNGADYGGSPGPLRGRKGEILEGGQRVPMIVRWPGRVPPRVSGEPAMNTDLFPTLLGLAGLPLPRDRAIDGQDLTPLLDGSALPGSEPLYFFPTTDSLPGAVRVGRFKYLRATGDRGRDRPQLSRLDADAEAHDLSRLHPAERDQLAELLEDMRTRMAGNPRGWRGVRAP